MPSSLRRKFRPLQSLRSTRPAAQRVGFTLIELLVVVAIIALLIAILLPSLSKAREQGKSAKCLSNMRSLMAAALMYYDEEKTFPSAGLAHGGSGGEEEKAWINQLAAQYGRDVDIARCPSDGSQHWNAPLPGTTQLRRTSFASNGYTVFPIVHPETGTPRDPFDRLDRIRHPARTVFWVELVEEGQFAGADHVHPENWWARGRDGAAEEMQIDQHLEKSNYAMIDGHAELLRFEKTFEVDPSGGLPPKYLVNLYDPDIAQ